MVTSCCGDIQSPSELTETSPEYHTGRQDESVSSSNEFYQNDPGGRGA